MIDALCIGPAPSSLGALPPSVLRLRFAETTETGIALAQAAPPQVVLAPLSALAALRMAKDCADLPILCWLADEDWRDADWGRADDAVEKDASAAEWLARCRRAVARRAMARPAQQDRRRADRTTGAETLTAFLAAAPASAEAARRAGAPLVLLVVAVQRLDRIHARWSRFLADALLRGLVTRAMEEAGLSCARLGEDSFALLKQATSGEDLAAWRDATLARLSAPQDVMGERLPLPLCSAFATASEAGGDVAALLAEATRRLRGETEPARSVGQKADDLAGALDNGEFELFYQMQIRLDAGAVAGLEALLRWRSPHAGLLRPSAFMPGKPEPALARRLTRWAVARALQDAALWRDQGRAPPRISVNVAAPEVADGSLPDLAESVAAEGARLLDFEIGLEDSDFADESLAAQMKRLVALGFGVTLAPRGGVLLAPPLVERLAPTRIMIRRADLREAQAPDAIAACRRGGVRVAVQDIETAADLRLAANLSCDEAQGHYIADPLPASKIMEARA